MFGLHIHRETHGPIFNGMAGPIISRGCDEAERDIAHEGADRVRSRLAVVLRHPTGRYMSHISVVERGGSSEVTDRGIIYGPWLEGTGSRNRTTRFKGYATFRRVAQTLDRDAARLADPAIDRAARRL